MTKIFGRKKGRISKAEKEALEKYLPILEIQSKDAIDLKRIFGRIAPLYVEIGFGNGSFLYEKALKNPNADFIGIEVFITGAAKLIRRMTGYNNSNLPFPSNIRLILNDARTVIEKNFIDNSITGVYILFPDPWQKKKHNKRRLINPEFANLLIKRLKNNGFIVVATDHKEYAKVIKDSFIDTKIKVLENFEDIKNTKYAKKAKDKKTEIFIYRFEKNVLTKL